MVRSRSMSVILATMVSLGVIVPNAVAGDYDSLGIVMEDFGENPTTDWFKYYIGTYPFAHSGDSNPVSPADCVYSYVYSEAGMSDPPDTLDTIMPVTAWWQTDVDWAFEIVLGNESPCEFGYLAITWDGQVNAPENLGGNWQGIALVCEVEQETQSGTTVTVPCPGTHYFQPFLARTDSVGAGQLIHSSFSAALRTPGDVDGFPIGPSLDRPDVTVRFGFVQNVTEFGPYPNTLVVANQNLLIEVGPSELEPPPPPVFEDPGW